MSRRRKRRRASTPSGSAQYQVEDEEVSFRVIPEAKKTKLDDVPPTPDEPEPRRSPNGFILPDPLPRDHVLVDNVKQKWVIGVSIGLGGFGEIYSARRSGDPDENYVIKVEPHSNGPLFTEIAFYLKCANLENIEKWKESKGLDYLGVANFVASGSLILNNKKFRFLVLPKFGIDLETLINSTKSGNFSVKTACSLAVQVIDALEFIHSHGYVHKDIKGSNLLLGLNEDRNRVFLIDFGLCSRYMQYDLHRPYSPDRRWAHEGTVEYTSRDCHLGLFSRRGDFEVLLYNLIEWLGGILPWEELEDMKPPIVQKRKISAFSNTFKFLSSCFQGKTVPNVLQEFADHVTSLAFEEAPAYDWLRELLTDEIKRSIKIFDEIQLNIELDRTQVVNKDVSSQVGGEKENKNPLSEPKEPKRAKAPPLTFDMKKKHGRDRSNQHISLTCYNRQKLARIRQMNDESLKNPTPAMVQQLAKINSRLPTPKKKANMWRNLTPTSITPAMQEVMNKRKIEHVDVNKGINSPHSDEDSFPLFTPPLRRKHLRQNGLTPLVVIPKPGSTKTSPAKRLRRNQTLPILETSLNGTKSSSFKNHLNNVVEAGSRLIRGLSRSLFSNFTN